MKVWVFAIASIFLVSKALSQDYEREKRWAAEVVPNLVVGDAVPFEVAFGSRVSGSFHRETAGKTAIVLVHGLGVHPDHGVVGSLRSLLADLGYTTLSIQMPVQRAEAAADAYPRSVSRSGGTHRGGAGWLAAKGYRRPVLLSHSMGSRMADAYFARGRATPFSAWVSLGMLGDFTASPEFAAGRLRRERFSTRFSGGLAPAHPAAAHRGRRSLLPWARGRSRARARGLP
jgi:predicted alpha/beta-hydrolase family hydrolase